MTKMFDFVHPTYRQEAEAPHWVKEILHRQSLILKNQESIMSTLQDAQAAQAGTDTAISALNADFAQMKTDIEAVLAKLNNLPAAGQLTPEQQAAIDDITTHATNINTGLASIGQNLVALDSETTAGGAAPGTVAGARRSLAGAPGHPVSEQATTLSGSDQGQVKQNPARPDPTNQPGKAPAGPL